MSILKQQVNSSSNFPSFFIIMTQKSSADFKLIHFLLWIKVWHQSPNFVTFKCSCENLPHSSCDFSNYKSVFLQILHHSSMSWDITSLYLFSWNFIYFQKKEPIKVQIWCNFMWGVESLKFCTLMGSFCQNHIKSQLKNYRRVIFHDTEQWCKVWINPCLLISKMAWQIGGTFIKALKSLKNYTLIGWFCPKHIMFRLETLYENRLVVWKMVNFRARVESLKICSLIGSFCPKHIIF